MLVKNILLTGKCFTDGVLTLEEIMHLCILLQPEEAASREESDLCVTPLITRLIVDGELVELKLHNGRWASGYVRVSGEVQRASGSAAGKTRKKANRRKTVQQMIQSQQETTQSQQETLHGQPFSAPAQKPGGVADGYSEEEQLMRQIRYFVRQGMAFKIYSDCGVTGEYPTNDPRLIRRLLEGKAARYRKIFERTMLDETSLARRTPEQIASMRAYMERQIARILQGQIIDDEHTDDEHSVCGGNGADCDRDVAGSDKPSQKLDPSQKPDRSRKKAYFRQAFTQLWRDITAGLVHLVAVSDRSRLCRAADMESEFLILLSRHSTRLVGLIEDLSSLDVSDPLKKGMVYMIASFNEGRLEETAGHSFRGFLQLLESGHPHGRLPWWLMRDKNGFAVEMPEYARYARRVVDLFLSGLGVSAIISKMHGEGVRVGGEPLARRMIGYVLDNDAVEGIQWQFGLAWKLFPPLLSPETVMELRERRLSRRDMMVPIFGERVPERTWANHMFTGLLRCSCGRMLRYSHPGRNPRRTDPVGYYYCPAPHKRDDEAFSHAYMNEVKLATFLEDLLGENPHLIAEAVSGGGDKAAKGAARRALVEERLHAARQAFAVCEAEAHQKARATALGAGIGEHSSSFVAVVMEVSRGLLEEEREMLSTLERELALLRDQENLDKRARRVLGAVEQLGRISLKEMRSEKKPGEMDARTCNSLLKTIFREITIVPILSRKKEAALKKAALKEEAALKITQGDERNTENDDGTGMPHHGCMTLHLAGVDTPLPPVRLRRGRGREILLPSVAEWIAEIFGLAPVQEDDGVTLNARTMHSFFHVLRDAWRDAALPGTALSRLVACMMGDEAFPRRSRGKAKVAAYMAQSDLYDGLRDHLDAAWTVYVQRERERLETRHRNTQAGLQQQTPARPDTSG